MKFNFNYDGKSVRELNLKKDGNVYIVDEALMVTVCEKEYPEYNASEWILYFENLSDRDSKIISDIYDCDIVMDIPEAENIRPGYMPKKGYPCVTAMNGTVGGVNYTDNDVVSSSEFNTYNEYLLPGRVRKYNSIGGRSSDRTAPFFNVSVNGMGAMVAIGWTGGWRAEFANENNTGIHIKTGLKEAEFYLKPGEKIRTTSVLIMKYSEDEDFENKFRRLIKNYFSHMANTASQRSGLLAYELWGGLTSDEMVKRLNELKAHDIKFEDVWIDAGWYGACKECDEPFSGDWGAYTGDWYINKRVHPDELKEVKAAAEAAGMRLMLWFEPERIKITTDFAKKHPDWLIEIKSDPDSDNRILYYGNEDAKEYVKSLLSEYIEKLNLSCYRQDFNCNLDAFTLNNDEENRKGICEIKHITGMYEIWDYLLEKHPGLIIDNCSSGGRRIDIETLKRSIPFFRSDYQCEFNENGEVLQTHNSNISRYLPYNGCTTKTKRDIYSVRSSYSSSWGGAFYNAIFQSMTEDDFKWAKNAVDEYREIRKYMDKDFYNHGSVVFDTAAWTIWQYNNPEEECGMVMAFRREDSPFDNVEIELKGMDDVVYTYHNRDTKEQFDGNNKLKLNLSEKRSSVIIEYRRK